MQLSDFLYFQTLHLETIAPRSKHSGTPTLELGVRRVCTIDGSPHPLPVIYRYGTSASDYTCCPNIHYLLYISYQSHAFSCFNYQRLSTINTSCHKMGSWRSIVPAKHMTIKPPPFWTGTSESLIMQDS